MGWKLTLADIQELKVIKFWDARQTSLLPSKTMVLINFWALGGDKLVTHPN